MIEAMEDSYPVRDLCEAFEVSLAGFYAWRQRGPSERDRADATLGEEISAAFTRSRRTYSSPHLQRALRRGVRVDGTAWPDSCVDAAWRAGCVAAVAPARPTATTRTPSRPTGSGSARHR